MVAMRHLKIPAEHFCFTYWEDSRGLSYESNLSWAISLSYNQNTTVLSRMAEKIRQLEFTNTISIFWISICLVNLVS